MSRYRRLVFSAVLMLVSACGSAADSGPVDGSIVFSERCAACHGVAGAGGTGPAMTDPAVKALSGEQLASVVRQGKGTMPGFPTLSRADVDAVVDHVKALASAD